MTVVEKKPAKVGSNPPPITCVDRTITSAHYTTKLGFGSSTTASEAIDAPRTRSGKRCLIIFFIRRRRAGGSSFRARRRPLRELVFLECIKGSTLRTRFGCGTGRSGAPLRCSDRGGVYTKSRRAKRRRKPRNRRQRRDRGGRNRDGEGQLWVTECPLPSEIIYQDLLPVHTEPATSGSSAAVGRTSARSGPGSTRRRSAGDAGRRGRRAR